MLVCGGRRAHPVVGAVEGDAGHGDDGLRRQAVLDIGISRVTRYQSYGITVSTYVYQWDSKIDVLAGADGGGWLKTETDALGRTLTATA